MKKKPVIFRYGTAILIVLFVYLIREALDPFIGAKTAFVVLFLLPAPISAWIGGVGPGVVATVLSLLVGDYYSFHANISMDARVVRIGTFLAEGIFISWLVAKTEMRRRALAKVESEAVLLQAAVGASTDGITVADACLPDRPLIYVNEAFIKNTGYKREELLGRNCRILRGADTAQAEVLTVRKALAEGEPCKVTILNYRKDGSPFWNELSISPIRDSSGKLTHFIGIQRDVTKLRKAQELLRESEQRNRALIESSQNGVFLMDEETQVLTSNQRAEGLFGYTVGEMMGKTLELIIVEREKAKYQQTMKRLGSSPQTSPSNTRIELTARNKIGMEFPAEFSLAYCKVGKKGCFSAIIQDISKRKAAEKSLLESHSLLEKKVEERTTELMTINEKLASEVTERRHIEAELKKHVAAIHLLQQVTFAANMTSGIHDILKQTLDHICCHTGWEVGHVYLPSETKTNELISTDFWCLKDPALFVKFKEATEAMKAERGMDLPGRVFITGKPVWVANLSGDVNFSREKPARQCGLKASVNIPVLVKEETVAVLEFFLTKVTEVDQSMLEVLADIGIQLGRVIERERNQEMLKKGQEELQQVMCKLRENQTQLIQSEKLASVGQLAAGVAHEINNPVGFISSNLNTMGEYVALFKELLALHAEIVNSLRQENGLKGKTGEMVQQYEELAKREDLPYILEDVGHLLQESSSGSKRVREIVNNLKSFARLDESALKEANINDGIEATLKLVWNELKYKCQVHKKLGDVPPINCYPGQLNQVFMNLLVNAGQAIKEKGEITIETSATENEIIIKISDTGAEFLPRISQNFSPPSSPPNRWAWARGSGFPYRTESFKSTVDG